MPPSPKNGYMFEKTIPFFLQEHKPAHLAKWVESRLTVPASPVRIPAGMLWHTQFVEHLM